MEFECDLSQVAKAIAAGSTNTISVRSVQDEHGSFPASCYSIESITLGLAPVALDWQNWGRTSMVGPVVGLKLGAIYAGVVPSADCNHLHAKITVTPPADAAYQTATVVEGKFIWGCITGRHPKDGALDTTGCGWFSFIRVENFPYFPRMVSSSLLIADWPNDHTQSRRIASNEINEMSCLK